MIQGQALAVGATSGIGHAIASMLARDGYDLTLRGRDSARLQAAFHEVHLLGRKCTSALVDVTDRASVREHLASMRSTGRLRAVVWAAGVLDWAPADQADPAAWEEVLQVNLTSAAVLTALVLPGLV